MSLSEQINHSPHGILRGFHEIRADPRRYVVSLGIKVPADGSMRDKPREAQIAALDEVDVCLYAHGRLNRRSAHLTISLCSVGISDREQRTLHLDRQIQLHALTHVADIHVSAGCVRRKRAEAAGLRLCDTHSSAKWFHWYARPLSVRGRLSKRAIVGPDVQSRVGKVVGQQAEVCKDSGPTPTRGIEAEQRDLQCIPRFRAVDIHRARDWIDPIVVDRREILGRGLGGNLAAQRVEVFELDAIPRRDRDGGDTGVIPAQVLVVAMYGMRLAAAYFCIVHRDS